MTDGCLRRDGSGHDGGGSRGGRRGRGILDYLSLVCIVFCVFCGVCDPLATNRHGSTKLAQTTVKHDALLNHPLSSVPEEGNSTHFATVPAEREGDYLMVDKRPEGKQTDNGSEGTYEYWQRWRIEQSRAKGHLKNKRQTSYERQKHTYKRSFENDGHNRFLFDQSTFQKENQKGEQDGKVFENTAAVTDLPRNAAKKCVFEIKSNMQKK